MQAYIVFSDYETVNEVEFSIKDTDGDVSTVTSCLKMSK
jgi:hypothetical protein